MKRAVLLLPPLFLLLSLDRLAFDRFPPSRLLVRHWDDAAQGLPGVNEGRFGRPGDPLNLVFVAHASTLRRALAGAGWTEVPTSVRGSLAAGLAELAAGQRHAAFPPMNDYRLLGRRQAMNWAQPIAFPGARHHFRLWNTGLNDIGGRVFWWGSGNLDLSVRWADLSHRPDPDADKERDHVIATLKDSPRLESLVLLPFPRVPREGVNDKGYPYRTDGRVAVIVLREPRPGPGPIPPAPAPSAAGSASAREAPRASTPPRPTTTPAAPARG